MRIIPLFEILKSKEEDGRKTLKNEILNVLSQLISVRKKNGNKSFKRTIAMNTNNTDKLGREK